MVRSVMDGHLDVPPGDAASALAWLVAAGVDTPVDAVPRAWLKAPTARQAVSPAPVAPSVVMSPTRPIAAPVDASPLVAAATIAQLVDAVAAFAHPLKRADHMPQLLVGAADSGIVIVCDQPETAGSPAETLRSRMLAAIGLDMASCALLHRLPWQTTGARAPRGDELAAFAPFVARALELVGPRLVLALGQHAAGLAGDDMALASARGRWGALTIGGAEVPMLATSHPRLLLAQPARKREAWADLQAFAARIRGEA